MDITQRYTTRAGRQFLIRLRYNEKIADTDSGAAFVQNVEVLDAGTKTPVTLPPNLSRFSTYERFNSFGGYAAINYFGDRATAVEGLRAKILTRLEDALERLPSE